MVSKGFEAGPVCPSPQSADLQTTDVSLEPYTRASEFALSYCDAHSTANTL